MNRKIKLLFGDQTHKELKEIYASADVFVAPSITAKDGDKEGFGLVFLEAMASGLPVVGSNSGGIPEVVIDGKNGLLTEEKNVADIAKKLNTLLENEELYRTLKNGALETAKKYDYSIIGQEYAQILNNAIK